MKVVVLGGVAAGTKVAAKLKRETPENEVVIYTKGKNISYAGCGLPYFVGGDIETEEELIVNTPEKFSTLTGVKVYTESEAVSVKPDEKVVMIKQQEVCPVSYDQLIIATGAVPVVPNMEGIHLDGVFTIRTPQDAIGVRKYIKDHECKKAVVAGAGFIGLEMAENLMKQGISVTVVDMASQVMPEIFDSEMADFIRRSLQKKGLRILTGTMLEKVEGSEQVTGVKTAAGQLQADLLIMSVGIRPSTGFLDGTGLHVDRGAILTDECGKTNLDSIYAVGDCALVTNRITGKPQWSAMGSTANIAGRNLALHLSGKDNTYPGCLGTGVIRLSDDMNAGRTGLTEKQAVEAGFEVETVVCILDDKAHYYPDSSIFYIKMIGDKKSHRLLGIQVVGSGNVDKMVDMAVTGISMKARIEDYIEMDFAYAPPFSTAIHPFSTACGILLNKMEGKFQTFTPVEYAAGKSRGYKVLDVHPQPSIPGTKWIGISQLEESVKEFEKDEKILLICAKGKRGYLVQNKMKAMGFTNVRVLEGGLFFNVLKRTALPGDKISPEEIKRVKGLGCLQDKRFGNIFNVRVITRNGKITTDEHRTIAEAAETFGSGEITMTTRLTMEIQGVPYEKIDALIEFLGEHGLETGGTGSLVRPVVSCKGTTCQYGLIDTFGLSEKIHERF